MNGRPGERLAGAGRDDGDGGLCAARCGSPVRAGRRGGLLTVWPRLGQHDPEARRSPRRVPPWEWHLRAGGLMSPRPGAAGPLILIPPEDGGPAPAHSRACRMAGPGIREVPGGGLHGGRPGGQDGHGPQDPRTAKAAGPAAFGPGRPARAAPPGQRRPRGRRHALAGAASGWCLQGIWSRLGRVGGVCWPLGLDLCWPGEDSGTVGGSLVSAGSGATSGIGSGPRLSSGFAGWPPVRGKL